MESLPNKPSNGLTTAKSTQKVEAQKIAILENLGMAIIAEPHEYRVDYSIRELVGESDTGEPLYQKRNSNSSPDPTLEIEESEILIEGHVKWDGCSNWDFKLSQDCMYHACSMEELLNIGLVLATCWTMTKELCENWSD